MGAPTHNIVAKVGEYQTNDGQQRARWLRVGSVFKHDDGGVSIKLECIPTGVPDWDGWLSVFPRDEANGQQTDGARSGSAHHANGHRRSPQRQTQPNVDFDDDIPF